MDVVAAFNGQETPARRIPDYIKLGVSVVIAFYRFRTRMTPVETAGQYNLILDYQVVFFISRKDLNLRPSDYELDELPLPILLQILAKRIIVDLDGEIVQHKFNSPFV